MPAALSNGLNGYWKLDESSGNASDSSGNGLTLTNNAITTYTPGKFANAGNFVAASSQFLSTATTISGVKTVSFWTNNASTTDEYINLIASTAYITSSSGTVSATGFTSPTIYVNGVINGTLTASVWNHVVITTNTGINANAFEVGRGNGSYNNGKIDDVRTYNRALSNNEVSQLYNWAPGPVARFSLDEGSGATAYDTSGYGNSGTWSGSGTRWKSGKFGGGGSFNGTDDRIVLSTTSGFSTGTSANWTIEAWVKTNVLTGTQMIAGYGDGVTDNVSPHIAIEAGSFRTSTWGTLNDLNGTAATVGVWYHVAGVGNGTSLNLYVNGVKNAGPKTITNNPVTGGGRIGVSPNFTDGNFNGLIDDVRIYNYARTQAQIIEDMNAGHPAPGSPVGSAVAYWKFDEGYSTTARDSNSATAGAEDLTLSSNTVWTNNGKFGKAWNGNGSSAYARIVADDSDLTIGAGAYWSASFWLQSNNSTPTSGGEVISKYSTGAETGYNCLFSTSGVLYCDMIDDSIQSDSVNSVDNIYDTKWHHIALVKTGNTKIELFVDGILKSTDSSIVATGAIGTGASFYVGAWSVIGTPGDFFNGKVDELKIFNSALTADQVKLDYNRGSNEVLGALSTNSNFATTGIDNTATRTSQSAASEYCIPGDSTTCTAPVGRWDLEEGTGTTAYDTSGNNNDLTLTNSPTYDKGKVGKGIDFGVNNTSNKHLIRADDSDFDFAAGGSFTIEGWVYYLADDAGTDYVISKFAEAGYKLHIDGNSGNLVCGIDYDSTYTPTDSVVSTTDFLSFTWHHFACVKDANSSLRLYVNGRLEGTPDSSLTNSTLANTDPLYIGIDADGTSSDFPGKIDHLRIYNYARTPAQVAWGYNRGAPLAQWKMDECQGTTINDSSGNSFSGTLTNAVTPGTCTTSGSWFSGVTGKRNYSLSLDGIDDYISVSDNANLRFDAATADFSLFAWVKRAANGTMNIISKEDADNDGYRLQFTSGNAVRCSVNTIDIDSTLTITDTNWHHIGCTITRDGNGQIYIDGQPNGTATAISSTVMATTSAIRLGAISYTTGSTLNGLLDDTKVYNYALTPTQVKTLYNDGTTRYGPVTGAP